MLVKQISVFLENKPGRLSEAAEVLAKTELISRRFRLRIPMNTESSG